MRLICPNCAAQYKVDAAMIPAEGRDVQCSNCGNTWFQNPDDAEGMLADERGVTERDTAFDIAPEPKTPEPKTPDPQPSEPQRPEPDSAGVQTAASDTPAETAPSAKPEQQAAPVHQPRPVDEAAREILREEARREAAARRRDQGAPLETQTDLGLDGPRDAETRAAAAKARLARLREPPASEEASESDAAEAAVAATIAAGSRRELLPDIEEINSTLIATSDRQSSASDDITDDADQVRKRRGFRFGFLTVFVIALGFALLYLLAPTLAEKFPQTATFLAGYLDWSNGILDRLDAILRRVLAALTSAN